MTEIEKTSEATKRMARILGCEWVHDPKWLPRDHLKGQSDE